MGEGSWVDSVMDFELGDGGGGLIGEGNQSNCAGACRLLWPGSKGWKLQLEDISEYYAFLQCIGSDGGEWGIIRLVVNSNMEDLQPGIESRCQLNVDAAGADGEI